MCEGYPPPPIVESAQTSGDPGATAQGCMHGTQPGYSWPHGVEGACMNIVGRLTLRGFLLVLFSSVSALAADPGPLIPRDVLFGNPTKTQARLSPDGKFVSYLAPRDGVLNVWVAPFDDPNSARPITNDTKRGIRQHFWAYDNAHVLYLQ